MDSPGQYVYLRDEDNGDYWSISWQPVGKPLEQADYTCRHGMSYSVYECVYDHISASQKMAVAVEDPVEIWDVKICNQDSKERHLSVYSYLEFSFHQIAMDQQNFQMSLYASGSSYEDGIIECDLFYEEKGYQFFTADFVPDGYDCQRDVFLGAYRTERNPVAVERGHLFGSSELGGNHCGSLKKKITLKPGEEVRLIFLLGDGNREQGRKMREKYGNPQAVEQVYEELAAYWKEKQDRQQVQTPDEGMNTLDKYDVTFVPSKGGARKASDLIGGFSMGYYITKKAWEDPEKKEAAVDFVNYMTSDDMILKFAQHSANPLKEAPEADTESMNSLQLKAIEFGSKVTSYTAAVQDSFQGECRVPTFDGMPAIVTGEVDAAGAVAEGFAIYEESMSEAE